jgi:EF hand
MRKRALALTASAVVLAFGVLGPIAQAQGPAVPDPSSQNKDGAGTGMMGRSGMMAEGMMGGGMMGAGHGMMGHGMIGQVRPGGMAPLMMRMMFSLMDADGDGKLSLQEFQAAHERIFKAIDANKDGFVTFEEMQNFMRGTSTPASQQ